MMPKEPVKSTVDTGDKDVLKRLAIHEGMPEKEVIALLESDLYLDQVNADILNARKNMITGAPYYLFDNNESLLFFIWYSSNSFTQTLVYIGGLFIPIMASAYIGIEEKHIPDASTATRILQTIESAFDTKFLHQCYNINKPFIKQCKQPRQL